jgi:3-oxoacyl-[acyl-carrier-protein] synthase-3
MATSYLSAISWSVGRRVPITDLDDPDVHSRLDLLRGEGLAHCRLSHSSVVDLATESADRTLKAGGSIAPDSIVYCSDTPTDTPPTDDLWDFIRRIGHPTTAAFTVGGSACGNLGPGLAIARSLLGDAGPRATLLVTSDRVRQGSRLSNKVITVLSDGAASCLVSSFFPGPSFRILGQASSVDANTAPIGTGLGAARTMARRIGRLTKDVFDPLDVDPAACRYLLTANYGHTPREFLTMAAGFDIADSYHGQLGEIGNCFASDILISLGCLVEQRLIEHGDLLLLLTTSPRSWSVLALEYLIQEPARG